MSEYPYPFFDEKGKVICQICGKAYLVISPTHLKKHNILYENYTKRFPDAPLSNEEFKARGLYGKSGIFDDAIGDEEYVFEEPEIEEEIDIEEALKTSVPKDPIQSAKNKVRDQLRVYYSNVRPDYLIEEYDEKSRQLLFQFITDFCDPVLRVAFFFPKCFWHNQEMAMDLQKYTKLEARGWKIIEIMSNPPDPEEIERKIEDSS